MGTSTRTSPGTDSILLSYLLCTLKWYACCKVKNQQMHPPLPKRVGTEVPPIHGVPIWGAASISSPPTQNPSRPQLPAASHLLGVLAVLSIAACHISMKFPVCVRVRLRLRGCSEGADGSARGKLPCWPPHKPPWRPRPPGLGYCWPRSACSLPTVSCQLAFLSALPRETLLAQPAPRSFSAQEIRGICVCVGGRCRYLLSHPVISESRGSSQRFT